MKLRRSGRLVDMTHYLLERPHQLIPLTFLQIVMNRRSHRLVRI